MKQKKTEKGKQRFYVFIVYNVEFFCWFNSSRLNLCLMMSRIIKVRNVDFEN